MKHGVNDRVTLTDSRPKVPNPPSRPVLCSAYELKATRAAQRIVVHTRDRFYAVRHTDSLYIANFIFESQVKRCFLSRAKILTTAGKLRQLLAELRRDLAVARG